MNDPTPQPTMHDLLAHAGFVRRLAGGLVRPDLVDDAVQEVWSTALERPPRDRNRLRGWLATVLRRGVAMRARADERRLGRERRRALPDAPSEAGVLVEREEIMGRMTRAVLALEDVDREVVLLRYYEDLPPRLIARRLGVPRDVVRDRLHRAVRRLRDRLGADGDWRRPLAGIAAAPSGGILSSWLPGTGGVQTTAQTKLLQAAACLIVFVGVVGSVAWWVQRDDRDPARPIVEGAATPTTVDHGGDSGKGVGGLRTVPTRPYVEASDPGEESSAVPDPPAVPPSKLVIKVVMGEGGAPVRDAKVFAVPWLMTDFFEADPRWDPRSAANWDGRGIRALTDARGEALVEDQGEPLTVLATKDGFSGVGFSVDRTSPLRIELHADVHVIARVVSPSGRPVPDVLVGLYSKRPGGGRRLEGTTLSDHYGLARIDLGGVDPRSLEDSQHVVAFAFPVMEGPETPVRVGHETQPPPELVLPPSGRVTVRILGSDGQPYRASSQVRLAVAPEDDAPADAARPSHPTVLVGSTNGIAHFSHVGLGLNLGIHVSPHDLALRPVEVPCIGPVRADEDVHVAVTLRERSTLLAGRLLDSSGTPVANRRILATLPESDSMGLDPRSTRGLRSTTAADGRFQFAIDRSPKDIQARTFAISIWEPTFYSRVKPRDWLADVPLPVPLVEGVNDVGDVQVAEKPFLVSGVVVDPSGGPVAGVEIIVERGEERHWSRDFDLTAKTGPDGTFSVSGNSKAGSLRLSARAPDRHCPQPVPFQRGETDVNLQVVLAGRLEGCLSSEWTSSDWIRRQPVVDVFVHGLPADSELVRPWDSRADILVFNGRFSLHSIPAGTVTVTIHIRGKEEPLLTVEGVQIEAGKVNRDPRLQEIDLAHLLGSFTVTVVDQEDRPLQGASVWVRGSRRGNDRDSWIESRTDDNGRARALAVGDPLEVLVVKEGWRTEMRSCRPEDTRIALRPASPATVVVTLAPGVEVPEPPIHFFARMHWRCAVGEAPVAGESFGGSMDHPLSQFVPGTAFGPDRTARIEVPEPGVYRVSLLLCHDSPRSFSGTGLATETADVIIPEGMVETSVTVTVDAAEVERAIEDIER